MTESDQQLAEVRRQGFEAGVAHAEKLAKFGSEYRERELERLRERVKELEQRLSDASRRYEIDGDQIVEIDNRYGYRWRGEKLKVGDRVLLPENWLSKIKSGGGTFEGVVTALGSTYQGDFSYIIRRL